MQVHACNFIHARMSTYVLYAIKSYHKHLHKYDVMVVVEHGIFNKKGNILDLTCNCLNSGCAVLFVVIRGLGI